MALWTDLIDPVEATGIARAEAELIEQARGGTLARYLPNSFVDSTHVKFYVDQNGLVDEAKYRAFNAPPEIGKGGGVKSQLINLPAIAREEPIDENTQMELARLSEDRIRKSIESAIRRSVQAIAARQERTRGLLIDSGKVLVDADNFWINDDFGRDSALSITLGTLWSNTAADRIQQLTDACEVYAGFNDGQYPGSILFGGRTGWAAFAKGTQFATLLANGATRPALRSDVLALVESAGLPSIDIYDRSTSVAGTKTKVLNANKVYLLPEPTDPNNEDGTALGATFWGRTISSGFPSWGIEPSEQPGIVAGVFQDEQVGSTIRVQADSIGMPVARNANASMAITVL